MPLPNDYAERVYAGVLGKIIGVYLGRPFEGWTYERIMQELGEIWYYVHERRRTPLIVTDDDISGTFTFLRALPDYGNTRDISPAQIGQTWLNYIIERRTILWWGGLGNSTEHTAYLRLKRGLPAPTSGSMALNGKVVAEQIGAQIFIDGWAMVAPGDPELAADLARRAASVSHDGEAVYGAQVLAAMEAQAFVEPDLHKLIDTAVTFIPQDSVIARMISDIREWHAEYPDWRQTREQIARNYGYDTFGGNCHMVPNHALIHLGLLYGQDDFQRSLMITNTAGWDTDCNSGNVGCLLGIKNGLAGIDAGPDWRGPVADRLYLPTADGGRAITDAVRETYQVVNVGRALAGEAPSAPKGGARFHFELPGSVQGWLADASVESRGTLAVENVAGHSARGRRSLALRARGLAPGRVARATTATFVPPEAREMPGYTLLAAPTLYPGQVVRARLEADAANTGPLLAQLFVRSYGAEDALVPTYGPEAELAPGAEHAFSWRVPDMGGQPIAQVGLEIRRPEDAATAAGTLYLDELTWEGAPEVAFVRPAAGGTMWRHAWVNGVDQYDRWYPETFRLIQNEGTGLLITGTREWTDYRFQAAVTPHMVAACGIAARVQGMRRYYALLLARGADGRGVARLVKALDGETVLAEAPCDWELYRAARLQLEVAGARLRASVDGRQLFDLTDPHRPLEGGGVALLCAEGRAAFEEVAVS
ncbi:MAG TPA: ADP-ribosylglycohydrolase family protein [Roseiflexaceae bacterium]|nr:ADP-ribosylglycohydrolase family protein [Roseiflexaceae bacterium]